MTDGASDPAIAPGRPPLGSAAGRPDAVRIEGVTKRFGALLANDDVSFEVQAGRVLGAGRRERRRQDHRDERAGRPLSAGWRRGQRRRRPASARLAQSFGRRRHRHGAPAIQAGRDAHGLGKPLARAGSRPPAAAVRGGRPGARADGGSRLCDRAFGAGLADAARRAPAARDPAHARDRRQGPDPRRADLGALAAGDRAPVPHHPADRGFGARGGADQPQARRGAGRRGRSGGDARRSRGASRPGRGGRCRPPRPPDRRRS